MVPTCVTPKALLAGRRLNSIAVTSVFQFSFSLLFHRVEVCRFLLFNFTPYGRKWGRNVENVNDNLCHRTNHFSFLHTLLKPSVVYFLCT